MGNELTAVFDPDTSGVLCARCLHEVAFRTSLNNAPVVMLLNMVKCADGVFARPENPQVFELDERCRPTKKKRRTKEGVYWEGTWHDPATTVSDEALEVYVHKLREKIKQTRAPIQVQSFETIVYDHELPVRFSCVNCLQAGII